MLFISLITKLKILERLICSFSLTSVKLNRHYSEQQAKHILGGRGLQRLNICCTIIIVHHCVAPKNNKIQ